MDLTKKCLQKGCTNTYQSHKFGKIKAAESGWYFPKKGGGFCPDHTPEWLEDWRKSREKK